MLFKYAYISVQLHITLNALLQQRACDTIFCLENVYFAVWFLCVALVRQSV
jgi:hypothetical protein